VQRQGWVCPWWYQWLLWVCWSLWIFIKAQPRVCNLAQKLWVVHVFKPTLTQLACCALRTCSQVLPCYQLSCLVAQRMQHCSSTDAVRSSHVWILHKNQI
jgi:hypothetical protein